MVLLMEFRRELHSLWGSPSIWNEQVGFPPPFFLILKIWFSNTEMIKEQLWHYPHILDPFEIGIIRRVLNESSCFKEIGQNWPNRCSCLCNDNNDTLCLFGTPLNCSCWLQGPSAKSWIQILWIYHTHRRPLAFSNLWMDYPLPLEWPHPFQKITSCFSGLNFPHFFQNTICENNVWEAMTMGSAQQECCNKYVRYINLLMLFIWSLRRKYWDTINYNHFSTSQISPITHVMLADLSGPC